MGGSGTYSTFSQVDPAELQRQIREAELKAAERSFSPQLSELLNDTLSRVNNRDIRRVSIRLDEIKNRLSNDLEDSFELKYGGSVAKHTYVDGLSDTDMLLVMKEVDDPKTVISNVAASLRNKIREASVSTGRIAITLKYRDGEEIQLIPAVRNAGKLHVPAWLANEWSRIDPDKFRLGLTKRNQATGMKVVPTIKLAKSVNITLPENQRLTGYHIESMAISAFKNYDGIVTVEKMLPFFVKKMSELVKTPIKDTSGQSVHVDGYLGKANSEIRKQISSVLDRISRRMDNATAAGSLEQWKSILGTWNERGA